MSKDVLQIVGFTVVLIVLVIVILAIIKSRIAYHQSKHFDITDSGLSSIKMDTNSKHHIIVPIDGINRMVLHTLRFACGMSNNVVAFNVETQLGEADKLRREWSLINIDVPLVIRESPDGDVTGPLKVYINSEESQIMPEDIITVLIPQIATSHWWQKALHNNTSLSIANGLHHEPNIMVATKTFNLKEIKLFDSELTNLSM